MLKDRWCGLRLGDPNRTHEGGASAGAPFSWYRLLLERSLREQRAGCGWTQGTEAGVPLVKHYERTMNEDGANITESTVLELRTGAK